jgi:hypothetical protein
MSLPAQIGIDVTDFSIRMAAASRSGGRWTIGNTAVRELPEGVVSHGKILDPARFSDVLLHAWKTLAATAPAVLCLPIGAVYAAAVTMRGDRRPTADAVRSLADGVFPESWEDLRVTHMQLGPDSLGLLAARADTLQAYADACAAAGIELRAVTTAPAVIAAANGAHGSAMLVWQPTPADPVSLTVLRDGWPVDEDLLDGSTPAPRAAEAVAELRGTRAGSGMPVTRLFVAAPEEIAKAMGTVKEFGRDALVVLTSSADDTAWIAATGAAKFDKGPVLRRASTSVGNAVWYLLGALLIVAAVAGVLWTGALW